MGNRSTEMMRTNQLVHFVTKNIIDKYVVPLELEGAKLQFSTFQLQGDDIGKCTLYQTFYACI